VTLHALSTIWTNFHQYDTSTCKKKNHTAYFDIWPCHFTLTAQRKDMVIVPCRGCAKTDNLHVSVSGPNLRLDDAISRETGSYFCNFIVNLNCISLKQFIHISRKIRLYRTTSINNITTPNVGYKVPCFKTNGGIFYQSVCFHCASSAPIHMHFYSREI
jgi:hypothetical protein